MQLIWLIITELGFNPQCKGKVFTLFILSLTISVNLPIFLIVLGGGGGGGGGRVSWGVLTFMDDLELFGYSSVSSNLYNNQANIINVSIIIITHYRVELMSGGVRDALPGWQYKVLLQLHNR